MARRCNSPPHSVWTIFWAYNGFGYENKPKFHLKLNACVWKGKITEEEYQAFLECTSIPDGLEVILEKS